MQLRHADNDDYKQSFDKNPLLTILLSTVARDYSVALNICINSKQ